MAYPVRRVLRLRTGPRRFYRLSGSRSAPMLRTSGRFAFRPEQYSVTTRVAILFGPISQTFFLVKRVILTATLLQISTLPHQWRFSPRCFLSHHSPRRLSQLRSTTRGTSSLRRLVMGTPGLPVKESGHT